MLEIKDHIYDYPKYYDLIFGAEWKPEFDFLKSVFDQYVIGKVNKLFEPACGTGRLMFRFAKAGYAIAGNDLNEKAVEFCNQRLIRHGRKPTAMVGDMTDFSLHRPVDAGFNTINSFRHLHSNQQAVDHLKCMATAIRKGGIYVLGFHLTPASGNSCEEEYWTAQRGSLKVNSGMWLLERNRRKRYENYGMSFDVETPSQRLRIVDQVKFRTYTIAQFQRLVDQVTEFELVDVFDFSYDADAPVEVDAETEDAVFVLRVR